MKIEVKRIIKNRQTGEEVGIIQEIDRNEVQCIYKDKFGVYLSLTSGYLIKVEETTMSELAEDQAVELQKRETKINKLKENIEYALFQRECDYCIGDNYIHFTVRKVFSILEECLEVFDETKS